MRRLTLILLCLPLLALAQKEEITIEALMSHTTPCGQGVAAAFAGQTDGTLMLAGGCNFPDAPAAEGGAKKFYDAVWYMGKRGWFRTKFALPQPTAYGAYVAYGDQGVVCIGGNDGEQSLTDVYRLTDKELKPWPSLPVGIDQAAAARDEKYVYLVGGKTDGTPQMTVYRLSIEDALAKTGQWEAFATLPGEARLQPTAVVQTNGLDHSLYVFGGYDPTTGKIAEDAQELNLKDLTWKSHPESRATVGMTAVTSGYSHVLFFGGVNKDIFEKAVAGEFGEDYLSHPAEWYRFNPDVLVYHTITDSWYAMPGSSLLARAGAGLVQVGDSYVLLDGESKPGIRSSEVMKVSFHKETHFGLLNWIVLVLYLVAMLGLGVYFMRRESGSDDFFRGGGRVPWWAAGISIYATMLSAITYMTIPAKAYATNWTYYPMLVCILLVSWPVVKYYLPYFRKLNITSAYEYLELRFNAFTRLMASTLFIVFMIARMALVLYLPSLALTAVTGIDIYICIILMGVITIIYCTMGGVEAVIWGDVIQGCILVGGAFMAAAYLWGNTEGGFSGALQLALDNDKLRLFDWGWDYRRVTFWVAILGGGIANNLISYTSDQTVIQRYLTTKDVKSASQGIWMNGLMSVFISVVFYFIGTGLYTFFKTHPAELDFTMAKGDAIFPFFMMSQMPQGIAGLLIAAIFAATMSTISANINSVSTAFSIDFWKRFRPQTDDKEMLRVARVTCVITGCIGVGIAILMATWNIMSLLDYFNTILGLLTSGLGGLFFMGLFLKRINGANALTGFIVGEVVVLYLQFFLPESARPSFMLYGAIGMVVSILTGWLLSLGNKKNTKLLMAAAFISLPMAMNAQTENPRGIYKMMTLTGRMGEVNAPFDQYKICTDSVTLMLSVQNAAFQISDTDHWVFNYTGDQPKDENDKSTLIYDSNAEHFTLKWWSTNKYHIYFPENDWCIEKYEANRYSEVARMVFEALNSTLTFDKENPLLGTWRVLGDVDELRDLKKALPKMHEDYESSKYFNSFYIFTPKSFAVVVRLQGGVANSVEYDGKKSYKLNNKTVLHVKWLTKDRIAVEERIDYRIDWKILERVTDDQSMMSHIASQHLHTH
ncbi:MAG: sodium/solute symporter [Bacteroidaceae bacterium]|nr:sodium/solute symporter [Bacteroidaceae bacterium]